MCPLNSLYRYSVDSSFRYTVSCVRSVHLSFQMKMESYCCRVTYTVSVCISLSTVTACLCVLHDIMPIRAMIWMMIMSMTQSDMHEIELFLLSFCFMMFRFFIAILSSASTYKGEEAQLPLLFLLRHDASKVLRDAALSASPS